jgi:hypothetical protein
MDHHPPVDIVDQHTQTTIIEVERDYCDACDIDVPAKLYAKLPSGKTLTFCRHHGTEYLPGLIADGATIIDHRYLDET